MRIGNSSYASRFLLLAAGISLSVLLVGLAVAFERTWCSLFVASFYFLSVCLGAAVFVALTHVMGAGWHVAFRRVPESIARMLPVAGIAMLIVLALRQSQYTWTHNHGAVGTFWFKELWLSQPFWLARAAAYVVAWSTMSGWLMGCSGKVDSLAGAKRAARLSGWFLALYAITFSLASVDWLMALEPLWFSTIWGVYQFAGMMQAVVACMVVMCLWLRRTGPLDGIFNDEHLHDLGKLLMGLSCFWMYIWFSQYMLIWYANIPEETSYYLARTGGAWGPVVVLCLLLNWVVPFFVLLPRPAKRSSKVMLRVAAMVLLGRWLDLYVVVYPAIISGPPVFSGWEFAGACLLFSFGGLSFLRSFPAHDPIARNDPFLHESLHYHSS